VEVVGIAPNFVKNVLSRGKTMCQFRLCPRIQLCCSLFCQSETAAATLLVRLAFQRGLKRNDREAGDHLEVANVDGQQGVAYMQRRGSDQQVRKWYGDAPALLLPVDLSG
jgi:hypothetical protein